MKRRMNGEGTIYYDKTKKVWIGQKSINGKRHKVSSKDKKELKEKLKNLEDNIYTNTSITLAILLPKIIEEKFNANITSESTYYRDTLTFKHINNNELGHIPIIKITSEQIQLFLNSKKELSQSEIKKIFLMLNLGFKKCFEENIIVKNPMLSVIMPTSEQIPKEVIAFEIWEQKVLIEHVLTSNLIKNPKSKYDPVTIKNLILLGLFDGMRIGELGAIDIYENINLLEEHFKITRTLTKDKNGKIKLGNVTKTGKKRIKKGKKDEKILPFCMYNKDFIIHILKEQIEIAQNTPNNINNLLFCRKDGSLIVPNEVNNIFKRICREARIKLELEDGCHFHMLRHTFATRCIEAGLELLTIAKLLGHSTTEQVEKTYGHILDKFRNQQLETLNEYYNREINIVFMDHFKKLKHA